MTLEEVEENLAKSNLDDEAKRIITACIRIGSAVLLQAEGQGPFISGHGGAKDDVGLPERLFVCPVYGLAGMAVYKKETEYSEPSY